VIGEMFIDGQNTNLWCRSKKPLNDTTMFNIPAELTDPIYANVPSCFILHSPSVGTAMRLYLRKGSECLPSGKIVGEYVLCE
jgi:hypothetical protein